MAEQRLIDANAMAEDESEAYLEVQTSGKISPITQDLNSVVHGKIQQLIADTPTIDPETLPIVRQLRAELERVTEERDAIKRDIEEAMKIAEIEFSGFLCEFCAKNPFCVKCNGPEWRGVEKEE